MFKDILLKAVYKSEYDNILEDFYIPALKEAISYHRAVGYFSAAMLSYAAQGLSAFVQNNGVMRLIIGGELDNEEFEAIKSGYEQRKLLEALGSEIINEIQRVDDGLFENRLEALAWLVANNTLDIKIAIRRKGMYHEKIGILTDRNGDRLVFQGSANESVNALLPDFNYESINVFKCWLPELQEHFEPHIKSFERLWANEAKDTAVVNFPVAAKNHLIQIAQSRAMVPRVEVEIELWQKAASASTENEDFQNVPKIPTTLGGRTFEIRNHQREALNRWKSMGNCHGILAHATGAGKTITAIYSAVKLFENSNRLFVIVSVPYQNLGDQWVEVFREFNIYALKCYVSREKWFSKLNEAVYMFESRVIDFYAVVVVNRTLQTDEFQRLLRKIPGDRLLWIGDECHHHGTRAISESLPPQAELRLGLSATPEHYIDESANERLENYYGKVVATYSLSDAIKDGVLTPYVYHVVPVELTDTETEEYTQLSQEIGILIASGANQNSTSSGARKLQMVLMRRARLLGAASNKQGALQELLERHPPSPHTLFYCGDGSVDDENVDEPVRQVELISKLVHLQGWKTTRFTSRESHKQRRQILEDFRFGFIDGLVAIRCLDEGIDIPACQTAYLMASSRNPRQFIQRRGRILRRSPNKSEAVIFDFLVHIPPEYSPDNDFERNLLVSELKRVAEFAGLSQNPGASYSALMPLLREYDLEHHLV